MYRKDLKLNFHGRFMTNEEKIIASTELKKELLRQLKNLDDDILLTQKEVVEHKKNVQQMKNELSEKMDFAIV